MLNEGVMDAFRHPMHATMGRARAQLEAQVGYRLMDRIWDEGAYSGGVRLADYSTIVDALYNE